MTYSWAPANEQQRAADDIPNAPFWPALNMADFCNQYAVPAALDNAMIKNALIIAAANTNRRLDSYRLRKLDEGQTGFVYWGTAETGVAVSVDLDDPETLADIPADTIAENSVLIAHYHTAVYCAAFADLLARQPMQSDDRNSLADQYASQSTAAIAAINGDSATGVWLI